MSEAKPMTIITGRCRICGAEFKAECKPSFAGFDISMRQPAECNPLAKGVCLKLAWRQLEIELRETKAKEADNGASAR